jgi:ABC-type uncharacterized transport system substrate-binding protein
MDRRWFLLTSLIGVLAAPAGVEAQPAARIPRVGIVADPPHAPNLRLDAFRERLRALGYVEGGISPLKSGNGRERPSGTPAIVADLIHIPVDVLVVSTTGATLAAKCATRTIPIVAAGAGAPRRSRCGGGPGQARG